MGPQWSKEKKQKESNSQQPNPVRRKKNILIAYQDLD